MDSKLAVFDIIGSDAVVGGYQFKTRRIFSIDFFSCVQRSPLQIGVEFNFFIVQGEVITENF